MARRLRCLIPCLLLAHGCGGSGDDQGSDVLTPGESVTVFVEAAAGGEVRSPGGVLTLAIPPGALDADTEITITELGEQVFDLQPEGLSFNTPAVATLDLPSDSTEPFVVPLAFAVLIDPSDGSLEVVEGLVIDPATDPARVRMTAEVPHFSILELTRLRRWEAVTSTRSWNPPPDRWPALNQRVRMERRSDREHAVYFVDETFHSVATFNIDTDGAREYQAGESSELAGRFLLRSGVLNRTRASGFDTVAALEPREVALGTRFDAGSLLSPIVVDYQFLCFEKGVGTSWIALDLSLDVDLTVVATIVRDSFGTVLRRTPIENPRTFPTTVTSNYAFIEIVGCITIENRLVDALNLTEEDKDDIKRAAAEFDANTCAQSCTPNEACELTSDRCAPLPSLEPGECEPPAAMPELLSVTPDTAPSGAQLDIRTSGIPFFGETPLVVFASAADPTLEVLGELITADSSLEGIRVRTPLDFLGNKDWELFIDYLLCEGRAERGQTTRVPFTARTLALASVSYQSPDIAFTVAGEPLWPLSVSVVPPSGSGGSVASDFFAESDAIALGGNRWQLTFENAVTCPGGFMQIPGPTEATHRLIVADQINQRAVAHFFCLE